jgi:hypothetical protein
LHSVQVSIGSSSLAPLSFLSLNFFLLFSSILCSFPHLSLLSSPYLSPHFPYLLNIQNSLISLLYQLYTVPSFFCNL